MGSSSVFYCCRYTLLRAHRYVVFHSHANNVAWIILLLLLLHKHTYYIVSFTIVVDCVRSADIVRPSDAFPVVPFPYRVSRRSPVGTPTLDAVSRPFGRRFTFALRGDNGTTLRRRACQEFFHFGIFLNNIPLACLSDPSLSSNQQSIIICRPLRSGQSRSLISRPKRRRFRRLFSLVLCLLSSNLFHFAFRSFAINIHDAS